MRLEVNDTNLLKTKFNEYLASDSKVIIISHSQGSLFTNNAFRELEFENPGNALNEKHFLDYPGLFRNFQIATPANQVLMPGNYITNNYDFIRFVPGAPSGNASFIFPSILNDPRGAFSLERQINHSLNDTYLQTHPNFKQLRDRVLQDIVNQASELESNCGKPPIAVFSFEKDPTNPMKYTFDASDSTDLDEQDPSDPNPVPEPPDFDILFFDWYVDGLKVMSGINPQFTFSFEGEHYVELVVTDREGNVNEEESIHIINVINLVPIADFSFLIDKLKVNFNASSSEDPDGSISSFFWSFGDGTFGTGATPIHTYLLPGFYNVSLTVTDNNGKSGTFQAEVEAKAGGLMGCEDSSGKLWPGHTHINPDGSLGGFVADSVSTSGAVVVEYLSQVCGNSILQGRVRITNKSTVYESTIIFINPNNELTITKNTVIKNSNIISSNVLTIQNSNLNKVTISKGYNFYILINNSILDNAKLSGSAENYSSITISNSEIYADVTHVYVPNGGIIQIQGSIINVTISGSRLEIFNSTVNQSIPGCYRLVENVEEELYLCTL